MWGHTNAAPVKTTEACSKTVQQCANELSGEATRIIGLEEKVGALNYHPAPVVLASGSGWHVRDVNGVGYFDFLSAYSALSHGHCHPALVSALCDQAHTLSLTSRAFYNDQLAKAEQRITAVLGYEKALYMNTGVEAVESAIKLARKWAYEVKGVEEDKAVIIVASGNFHGRTTTVISFSSDEQTKRGFGPFTPGFVTVEYGSLDALEMLFTDLEGRVAGVLLEPIQGEGGIVVPPEGYLQGVHDLCKEQGCLFIADEIQTGLGRTGAWLCHQEPGVRADVVLLGKALGGGLLPVSCVLADSAVMDVFKPGDHGSTYGGNPLAARVAVAAIDVIIAENLCYKAEANGKHFMQCLESVREDFPHVIQKVRGRGLLIGLVLHTDTWAHKQLCEELGKKPVTVTADALCEAMRARGLLAKPTHQNVIRLAPPLATPQQVLARAALIIQDSISYLTSVGP